MLPACERGVGESVRRTELRNCFRFGMYSGRRRAEVLGLRWDGMVPGEGRLRVDETKSGKPLEPPVIRPLAFG